MLFEYCDGALIEILNIMKPSWLIGIGNFAFDRIGKILKKQGLLIEKNTNKVVVDINSKVVTKSCNLTTIDFKVGKILHPSPACPQSRQWATIVSKQLTDLGVNV